jgi:thiol-disulfide isomerase/thioredoxin
MPSLSGATEWLMSEPLAADDLKGRVVLVDFGTYTCINWLRTLPHIRAWEQKYRPAGLVVVGIQTPEFEFEQNRDSVRREVAARAIDWPVAIDNRYEIWRAFGNRYWPALYFIDRDGVIRDHHFGEGRYEKSERAIQQLLGVERELVAVEGTGVEAAADWDHLLTAETYVGYERGVGPSDARPDRLRRNHWALDGEWTIGPENVRLDRAGGTIAFRFHARDAHVVLSRGAGGPIPFRVLLDGQEPGLSHGVDVDEAGDGVLQEPRMYQLIRQHDAVRERTLEITFREPGAEAYSFTFG